jgi:hypothetical protein
VARRSGFEFAAGVKRALKNKKRRQRRWIAETINRLGFAGAASRAVLSLQRRQAGQRGADQRAAELKVHGSDTERKIAELEARLRPSVKPRAMNKEIGRRLHLHYDYVRKLRSRQKG